MISLLKITKARDKLIKGIFLTQSMNFKERGMVLSKLELIWISVNLLLNLS